MSLPFSSVQKSLHKLLPCAFRITSKLPALLNSIKQRMSLSKEKILIIQYDSVRILIHYRPYLIKTMLRFTEVKNLIKMPL